MPDSPDLDQTSNSTLAKLLEVDSELAVQEAELLSKLESIQEKRRSLKTVISLFTTAGTPATAPIESPAQALPAEEDREIEPLSEDSATSPLETPWDTATAFEETAVAPDTESKVAKKTAPSPTKRHKTTKLTLPAKAVKKPSGWQQYVREEFRKTSLPEAVSLVMQRQTNKVFQIPAIVDAIFVDELPKEVGTKARRQVTNILSEGARKNKWYRGQIGYYSMSRAAAEAKS